MTELFDKNDVITVLTREHVKVGDKGYFGDSLARLATDVEHGEVHVLAKIYDEDFTLYPFKGDHHANCFALFLPADKVKNKEPVYRPFQNISELFDFMMPEYADEGYTTDDMVDLLLGQHYTLKDKDDGTIRYYAMNFLSVSAFGTIILDDFDLTYLFDKFEYRKGDEWVPFGVIEE